MGQCRFFHKIVAFTLCLCECAKTFVEPAQLNPVCYDRQDRATRMAVSSAMAMGAKMAQYLMESMAVPLLISERSWMYCVEGPLSGLNILQVWESF